MWWFLQKKTDTDKFIVYTYGRETKTQTGEISYDKSRDEFDILKLADNDTQKSAERLLPHLYRVIFKENCPDERQIAIG